MTEETLDKACRIIIDNILNGQIQNRKDLEVEKRQLCRQMKLSKFMSNADILERASHEEMDLITPILQKKPTRTLSGVAIVAVMCHPHKCPHGRCFYCPESSTAPPSYTGEEPAALRGRMFKFHPYIQTYNRLMQLHKVGHPIDKVELIIMGGTFPSLDICYQEWFVSQCLKAMVDFGIVLDDVEIKHHGSTRNLDLDDIDKNILKQYPPYSNGLVKPYKPNDYVILEDIQKANESSKIRCIGMTFETRPDYCKPEHINRMLKMGVTRVELGVQTIHDDIYKRVKRGHTVADSINANRNLRDSAIKVAMHFMPGLFQNQKEDLEMFKTIFTDQNYKPDMLKIYPVLVTKGSELYDLWLKGGYEPYTTEEAVDLIVEIKKILPKWVRTMRIQRDIPTTLIQGGISNSNLGEFVYKRLEEENINCQCIRCREIGHKKTKEEYTIDDYQLFEESYDCCNGVEHFLSIEDKNEESLAGFLRLRLPSPQTFREEITGKSALIRELHVYGNLIHIGKKSNKIGQHTGFGKQLLKRAEEIAIDNNKEEILIISGIGTRNYYRKFGYERKGPYMAKKLI